MKLRMPQRKRELLGITSIILGCILSVHGGANLGKKVEWWGSYFTDKIEAVYDNRNPLHSLEELKKESEQIKNNFYTVVGGLTLVLGGAIISGTRESIPPISKPTDYSESLSSYSRRVYKL
ncbi:MAG: hypothetical protein Q8N63_04640 [Nanoarchaeota archaeon]|nr:hypothetical protein [Nanoarchaeota archaeon]